jgi:hypothetical protein
VLFKWRCDSREFLEFDHAEAWTWSKKHSIEGITLRCRAHNQLRARNDFGEAHMARFQRSKLPSASATALDPNRGATGFESSWPLPWSSAGSTAESP